MGIPVKYFFHDSLHHRRNEGGMEIKKFGLNEASIIMKSRNSYLINRSLGKFLIASVATMLVLNVNSMVDSVLMGHLIGPGAVSAIQNVVPVAYWKELLDGYETRAAIRGLPKYS